MLKKNYAAAGNAERREVEKRKFFLLRSLSKKYLDQTSEPAPQQHTSSLFFSSNYGLNDQLRKYIIDYS